MAPKKMKITDLYIYPIKSLCPLSVRKTRLRREGLQYDRRFMLLKVLPDGGYKNIQTVYFPECTLFDQTIQGDGEGGLDVVVTYRIPEKPLVNPPPPEQSTALRVPLNPTFDGLDTVDIELFGSPTFAYRMGDSYDAWFSSCLGYPAVLVYIGENRRPVLAHSPPTPAPLSQSNSWLSSITSYIPYWSRAAQPDAKETNDGGLAFNEAAPFLVTSKASLREVSTRLPSDQPMNMIKFRPNIVVDEVSDDDTNDNDSDYYSIDEEPSEEQGEAKGEENALKAYDEDHWAELRIRRRHRLALTANCARCASINIDYSTGRPGTNESGSVLKKLMKDRRVDTGNKWSPIFGRYAFLLPPTSPPPEHSGDEGEDGDGEDWVADVAVGDEVEVTKRNTERDVWAWPK
ncbi:MOSC domain-containing protein [Hypoxylon trugodes]|uniref:MOSC domain-containing protein n=1 Tax=Hypoxylon trugodes TaxID=326681 RepID=UPI00219824C5|nr:MOSC domain-containing protein [Hypoxylon trugodes]KAI1386475.1 MOSC domain-containing protein [Hypoxylon trugodes]